MTVDATLKRASLCLAEIDLAVERLLIARRERAPESQRMEELAKGRRAFAELESLGQQLRELLDPEAFPGPAKWVLETIAAADELLSLATVLAYEDHDSGKVAPEIARLRDDLSHRATLLHRWDRLAEPQAVEAEGEVDTFAGDLDLTRWAVGCEGDGRWWLFRRDNKRKCWMERGQVAIPRGRANAFATMLARNGGRVTKREAIALYRSTRKAWGETQLFKNAAKPARKDVSRAIQKAMQNVTRRRQVTQEPLPWDDQLGWDAEVRFGYAIRTKGEPLKFQTYEELQQPENAAARLDTPG